MSSIDSIRTREATFGSWQQYFETQAGKIDRRATVKVFHQQDREVSAEILTHGEEISLDDARRMFPQNWTVEELKDNGDLLGFEVTTRLPELAKPMQDYEQA